MATVPFFQGQLSGDYRIRTQSLSLERLDVVHAGTDRYQLAERVRALPAAEFADTLHPPPGR